MYKAFLIKYSEIGTKGKNRYLFEEALADRIRRVLEPVEGEFKVIRQQGRIFVETTEGCDYEDALEALKRVFGISGICPAVLVEDEGFDKLGGADLRLCR